jgi:hypothetical protein
MNKLFCFCLLFFACTVHGAVIYVTPSGTGNGSSWSNALPGSALQNAINTASPGDTIWVACGTYHPTTTTSRTISFQLKNGVAVYGSFAGTETSLQQRILACGPCSILSGDIGTPNDFSDNSYHVLFNTGNDTTAVLDGFVVRDGNANGTVYDEIGGGILNNGNFAGVCTPVIRNCFITANQAHYGGGIFNNGSNAGNASPHIINCIITSNSAFDGGGIDNYGYAGNASPHVINCVIASNHASLLGGGGMYCWGGGGGNASPLIQNCTIVNNTSDGYGGGVVTDNSNTSSGNSGSSNPVIRNTVLWNNTAAGQGPQFYRKGTALFDATFSCVDLTNQQAPHLVSGSATGMVYTNPFFTNSSSLPGSDNCLLNTDDGLQLLATSPLINAGTAIGAPLTDIRGVLRSAAPDMGAYEADMTLAAEEHIAPTAFEIYPNPVSFYCTLYFKDEVQHNVQIYNSCGALFYNEPVTGRGTIAVASWPAGVYLVVIDRKYSKRIIRF